MSDVVPGYSNVVRAEKPRIFLNENLTNYKRGLISRASEMKKDGLLTSFWTCFFVIFLSVSIKAYLVLDVMSNKQIRKIISLNVRVIFIKEDCKVLSVL